MKIEQMHTFAESFITEDEIIQEARARGVELGSNEASTGTGATLKFLAAALQSKATSTIALDCNAAARNFNVAPVPVEASLLPNSTPRARAS